MLGLYYMLVYLLLFFSFQHLIPVLAAAMLSAVKSLMVIWYYV